MSELTVAGRYRILKQLAEGGMGRVLLARTEGPAGFSKTVVLKTLHRYLAEDLSFLEFFLAEARLAAVLHHPNVAQVFELVEEGGEYFLALFVSQLALSLARFLDLGQLAEREFEGVVVLRELFFGGHGYKSSHLLGCVKSRSCAIGSPIGFSSVASRRAIQR